LLTLQRQKKQGKRSLRRQGSKSKRGLRKRKKPLKRSKERSRNNNLELSELKPLPHQKLTSKKHTT